MLEFIAYIAIGYIVTKFAIVCIDSWVEAKYQMTMNVTEKLKSMIHIVKEEKHQDTLYWFDRDSDKFLGQGMTTDELIDSVKSKFPTHIFLIDNGDPVPKGIQAPDWKPVPISKLNINIEI